MSLMKRYAEDSETLADRAAVIAWTDDTDQRFEELRALYADCHKAADIYADPAAVAELFVQKVTDTFHEARGLVVGLPALV
ncbi:hypothetical protein ABZ464_02815 [Streptomyces sp. NPDC005820]|uniref:hypothetical protein n=1 Tax=Streptomyces sp. NPDC005820 TaxID=3157069 RepID=UPI003406846C